MKSISVALVACDYYAPHAMPVPPTRFTRTSGDYAAYLLLLPLLLAAWCR